MTIIGDTDNLVVTPEDVLWQGKHPYNKIEYRIVQLNDDNGCFIQEKQGDAWHSDIHNNICAVVYATAFLEMRFKMNQLASALNVNPKLLGI